MRFYVTTLTKNYGIQNYIDKTIYQPLSSFGFRRVRDLEDCDFVIVEFQDWFEALPYSQIINQIKTSKKPIVVIDYSETNQFDHSGFHVLGKLDSTKFHAPGILAVSEQFHNLWGQVRLYFKRELPLNRTDSYPFPILPIDYLVQGPFTEKVTSEEFNNRIISLLMIWCFSNNSRALLQGELTKWAGMHRSYQDTFILHERDVFKTQTHGKIALLYRTTDNKIPQDQVLKLESSSHIIVSLNGAGQKCFRDAEAPVRGVMARQQSSMEYKYPWIHGENCIILPYKEEEPWLIDEIKAVEIIEKFIVYYNNYAIYENGYENAKNYLPVNYLGNYIVPEIRSALRK